MSREREDGPGHCPKCGHDPVVVTLVGELKVPGYVCLLFGAVTIGFWVDSYLRLGNRDGRFAALAIGVGLFLLLLGRYLKGKEPTVEVSCEECDFLLEGSAEECEMGLASARIGGFIPGRISTSLTVGEGVTSAKAGGNVEGHVRSSAGALDDRERVVRGGAYSDTLERCRSAARDFYQADFNSFDTGFRVSLQPRRGTGAADAGEVAGASRTRKNSLGMELQWIQAGSYTMGSPADEPGRKADEGPCHDVEIRQGFWLASTPTTAGKYRALPVPKSSEGFEAPSTDDAGTDEQPATHVSWHEALAFCRRLTVAEADDLPAGWEYTLPSEAQWEYACRAETTGPYSFGDSVTTEQVVAGCDGPQVVGKRAANEYGLHDMHGNVREWCYDLWHDDYQGAPTNEEPWE